MKESSQFVPRNHILWLALSCEFRISTVVEVAMRGIGDDEQLFVLWHGIGLADKVIALSLSLHHILIGSFAEVARMGFLSVHNHHSRTNLVDVVEEAGIGVAYSTYGAPAVVAIA